MILPKSFIATCSDHELEIEIPEEWIGKKIEVIIDEINATVLLRKLIEIPSIENIELYKK